MASINLSGVLRNPNTTLASGGEIRLIHRSNTGEVVAGFRETEKVNNDGTYDFNIQYGNVFIQTRDVGVNQWTDHGTLTINQDTTATTLPELLNAAVPPTEPLLLELQQLLSDAEAAAASSEQSAIRAETAAQQAESRLKKSAADFFASGSSGVELIEFDEFFINTNKGGGVWVKTGNTGLTPSLLPLQTGNFTATDSAGVEWELLPSTSQDINSLGYLSSDDIAPALFEANSKNVTLYLNDDYTANLTQENALDVLTYSGQRAVINKSLSLSVGDEEISISDFVDIDSPYARNLFINGVNASRIAISSLVSATGSASNWDVTLELASTSGLSIGHYLLVSNDISGTGRYREIRGAWKITAINGLDVTIKHHHSASLFPAMTITGGTVKPLKSRLRWVSGVRGLAVLGVDLGGINWLALLGSFDPATESPSDGPIDGLMIGDGANTPETGSTLSKVVRSGTAHMTLCAVNEWNNNGAQVLGGRLSSTGGAFCSNGHRGLQAADGGSCLAKFNAFVANGSSGCEAEGNGFINAAGSVTCGNKEQGHYAISGQIVANSNSYAGGNLTSGVDARDGGVVKFSSSESSHNQDAGIRSLRGSFVRAENAKLDGNVIELIVEYSTLDFTGGQSANNASGRSVDSNSVFKSESGEVNPWVNFPVTPAFGNVTYTDNGTVATYKVSNGLVFWKIQMSYSTLDTSDSSVVTIENLPTPIKDRLGGVEINLRRTTGLSFASTDTFGADYNTISDVIVIVDSSGALLQYNSGKINASGDIYLSGWYQQDS